MHFKRIGSSRLEDISIFDSDMDFSQMGSLHEDELEFLQNRKKRTSPMYNPSPDPRKGGYDEES
jgi:hypothetical protein